MSLLSDILTSIKTPRQTGSVPPGLIKTVSSLKNKRYNKRLYGLLGLCALIILAGGGYFLYEINAAPDYSTPATPRFQRRPPPPKVAAVEPEPPQTALTTGPPETVEPPAAKKEPAAVAVTDDRAEAPPAAISEKDDEKTSPPEIAAVDTVAVLSTTEGHSGAVPSQPVGVLSNNVFPSPGTGSSGADRPESLQLDYYLYTGDACERRGDYLKALGWYKKASLSEPWDYRLQNKIAHILLRISLYDDAVIHLEKALSLKEDYVPALVNMGIACAKRNDFELAERHLLKALAVNKTSRSAIYNIFHLYQKRGEQRLAAKYREKMKSLGLPIAQ